MQQETHISGVILDRTDILLSYNVSDSETQISRHTDRARSKYISWVQIQSIAAKF